MPIPQFITDNTDDGRDIIRFLIDVMNDNLDGAKLGHRLSAARLLVIYQHADASDFIADNRPDIPDREWSRRIRVTIDPAISSLISQKTDGGREICLFLIDVMKGGVEGIHVGHRVWAARELLNRAFGKSTGRPLPKAQGSTASRSQSRKPRRKKPQTPEAAAFEARVQERIAASRAAKAQAGTDPVVHPELVEGPQPAAHLELVEEPEPTAHPVESPPRREPDEGPDPTEGPEPTQPEFDDDLSASIYRASSRCIDPNFDPMRAATDDYYFWNYDGCNDIRCPYHGDPEDPDFHENPDPNAHHY